ncbi:MAG: cyclase family protein [Bryobacteraceae bacterium]|jgi:kynurenine formamidase
MYVKPITPLAAATLCIAVCAILPGADATRATRADVDRWMTELSNWGRWGKDDQKGTLNLITPAVRKRAAALVHSGISVSLARTDSTEDAPDNKPAFVHEMLMTSTNPPAQFAMDRYTQSYHGSGITHLDALCHMFYRGTLFNGFPRDSITQTGAAKLDVLNIKDGIFARGILIDIPRLKGQPFLEPGEPIYPEDLDAWIKKVGIQVAPGDVVLIRTGRWARRAKLGPWDIGAKAAGLYASCAGWLHARDAAVLGSDFASDVMPSGVDGVPMPIHQLALVAMGMPILDNCDLEALSETAARLRRWEFLIVAAPEPVPGGTGSPINPVAVF